MRFEEEGIRRLISEEYAHSNNCYFFREVSLSVYEGDRKKMARINQEEYEKLKKAKADGYEWVAKDMSGGVFAYKIKPEKYSYSWIDDNNYRILSSRGSELEVLRWDDEEPYSIVELIEGYEKESEETEVKKDIEWLKEQLIEIRERNLNGNNFEGAATIKKVLRLINQLDEPETLLEEWIDENKSSWTKLKIDGYYIPVEKLQNLLVPKQEEANQAYKDGYEKGKQHTFYKGYLKGLYKGYLKGLADKGSINPERSPEVDQHKELLDELNDLYARKNKDYGNSFDDSLDEDGLLVLKIRLGDKFKRFSQLINNEQMVNDESMRDTLIDLANYALMGVMWMDKNEEEE